MTETIDVLHSGYVEVPEVNQGPRGSLVYAEVPRQVPFEVRRFYCISRIGDPHAVRGKHAHRELEQVMFCIQGNCLVDLDDGQRRQTVRLHRPSLGVRLGAMLWHEMRSFTDDCIILVLASDLYDESDYIRDYTEFQRLAGERG